MIPKVIHYCWFGGNPLPNDAKRCIASWRKYMPEYEIKEWNEDNFDVNVIPYTQEAYRAKKYAFVSDYARFWILYNYGGLYFDTDVEVIRPLDEIVDKGPFLGYEIDSDEEVCGVVNPGQGMCAEPRMSFYELVLKRYATMSFILEDGSYNTEYAVVRLTTDCMKKCGLTAASGTQSVAGINIFPKCYFNPFDDTVGRLSVTDKTHTIHWYSKSWMNISPARQFISRLAHRLLGVNVSGRIKRMMKL